MPSTNPNQEGRVYHVRAPAKLEGNGTSKIIGFRNQPGVTKTSLGANGAVPTLNDVADALYRVRADNGDLHASTHVEHLQDPRRGGRGDHRRATVAVLSGRENLGLRG